MNRTKSWLGLSGLTWLAIAGIVGAGACTSSSGNEGAAPPTFDAGLGDVTFQDTGIGADGSTTFSVAGCLTGALSAGGAACETLATCVQDKCASQLISCFGSGWDAGTVAPSASCASLATCAMNSSSCTKSAGLACFDAATNSCQCCVQDIATCTRTNCAADMLGCSTNLLGALPSVTCCAAGQTACSGACVDEQTDNANCGACAHACTGGQACQAGTCACPSGTTLCSGTCVDEQAENANCGACGNACATGQTCVSGTCTTPMCTSPEVLCLGTCVNEQTDSNNCGACDNACASGQTCANGTCTSTMSCLSQMIECGGSMIDPCTSQDYCGASGNCQSPNGGTVCDNPIGEQCYAGTCKCPPGEGNSDGYCTLCTSNNMILCSTSCVDPNTDNANCGTCGHACTGSQTCQCSGACLDLQTDPNNCGACANVCTTGQTCVSGACTSPAAPTGNITFGQCTTPSCDPSFYFLGGFGQGTTIPGCTTTTSGACTYSSCPSGPMPLPGVSAGTLTISGGSIPAGTTVPFSAGYSYYTTTGTLFTAGQTLTVSASGSTVPAFASESLIAPALVTLTSPSGTSGYTISTSSALSVTWTGGQSGAMFNLQGASASGDEYFACSWNAMLGQATVPQSILAGLSGMSNGSLLWGQYTTNNFTAGSYAISEEALLYGSSTANFTP